jgi:hypothetical protein
MAQEETIMGQAHPYFETPKIVQQERFREEIAAWIIAAQAMRDRIAGHRILPAIPARQSPAWESVQ